ncbi:CLIPD6 protein [Anopheles sinensis]|uniref:CLIPD6 protein n=1 Tax=Anopheles sinensis TaxID=74873 RepID=A0A084W006_ANOSI|nr:CLIPD6 protein [Anopheles sinensis]
MAQTTSTPVAFGRWFASVDIRPNITVTVKSSSAAPLATRYLIVEPQRTRQCRRWYEAHPMYDKKDGHTDLAVLFLEHEVQFNGKCLFNRIYKPESGGMND